jgi:hypothetical protein
MKKVLSFAVDHIVTILIVLAVVVMAVAIGDPSILAAVAVTEVARKTKVNVAGARTIKQWSITGDNAQTLDTGIKFGKRVVFALEPSTITAIAQSDSNGQIRLTFTASGAFTAVGVTATIG